MESLRQDLRYAVRALRRNPAYSAIVVLVLAVGIGANGLVFSVIDVVLLMRLALAGVIVGAVGASLLGRLLTSQLYGIETWDPRVLILVATRIVEPET